MNGLLKKRLQQGETVYGLMLSELYVPNITRLLASCGYDYLLVDCEHGYFDMTQVANLIAVAEGVHLPVIIRVTQPSRTQVTKYLDMGASGILLSNAVDAKEARRLAEVCLYAPKGDRGISTFRAHTGYCSDNVPELMRCANDSVIVICQIESPHAVAQTDQILSIDGIDGVMIGPNDLSQHMGIMGQMDHPDMTTAMMHVADCAKNHSKFSGVITTNAHLLTLGYRAGMRCFSVGSELNALHDGAICQLKKAKELLNDEEAASK